MAKEPKMSSGEAAAAAAQESVTRDSGATAGAVAPEPARKPARPIAGSAVKVDHAGIVTTVFHADVGADVTIEDVLRPDFWSNVTDKFMVGSPPVPALNSRIVVDCADGSWSAQLVIKGVQRQPDRMPTAIFVMAEWYEEHDGIDERYDAATHATKYKNERLGWCIVRIADDKVIADGFDSEAHAKLQLRPADAA